MTKKSIKKPQITPRRYRTLLNSVHLNSLRLKDLSCKVERMKILNTSEELTFDLKDDVIIEKPKDLIWRLVHNFSLKGKVKGVRSNILSINASFVVEFSAGKDIDDQFFEIYSKTSLVINTWPYFRELVGNLTGRMDIPRLNLPLLKGKSQQDKK